MSIQMAVFTSQIQTYTCINYCQLLHVYTVYAEILKRNQFWNQYLQSFHTGGRAVCAKWFMAISAA